MALTRYNTKTTSFEIKNQLGGVFVSRSFCDDPAGQVYITKDPVCKLTMNPNPQILGSAFAWDISSSRSATGTVDTFDISWGGATDIGDLSNQDWAIDPKSGNVTYDNLGTYQVVATVTDTLGNKSKPCKLTVYVVNNDTQQRLYFTSVTDGIFYILPDGTITAINTGLTGGDLQIRDLGINPASTNQPVGIHNLWIATLDGVGQTQDGGGTWTLYNKIALGEPNNTAGDAPAPTSSQLDQIGLNVIDLNRVQVLRTMTSPVKRSWIYFTSDGGASWGNVQII